jgi:GNAT superfamily N-acetyltransferase
LVIRVAREEDASSMSRVIVDTFLTAHQGQLPEAALTRRRRVWTYEVSERSWVQLLRDIATGASPRECAYVAEDVGGEVVGLATGGPAEAECLESAGVIHALFVQQSHQRRGLGCRLIKAVAAHLAELGMTALVVHCWAANGPARQFYEALGGIVVREREVDEFGVMVPEVMYSWEDIRTMLSAVCAKSDAEPRSSD